MPRTIEFTSQDGVPFTLEYNRKVFTLAEQSGFSLLKLRDYPLAQSELIFYFGLTTNHRTIAQNKASTLFDDFLKEFELVDFMAFVSEEYEDFFSTIQPNSEPKKKLQIKNK